MPFLIGACCIDQILEPEVDPQDAFSGLNEIIPFDNVDVLIIPWTAARKARFGEAGVIQVEIQSEDGQYRTQYVQMVPDDILVTTQYTGDLGRIASGRAILT
jgi:hypothetical protein